jgi:hypothetical protein
MTGAEVTMAAVSLRVHSGICVHSSLSQVRTCRSVTLIFNAVSAVGSSQVSSIVTKSCLLMTLLSGCPDRSSAEIRTKLIFTGLSRFFSYLTSA